MDRYQFFCRVLDLSEEFSYTGGLSGARQALADRVERPAAPETGLYLEREFAHLGVTELELLGYKIYLQHIRVAEERFVPHQQVLLHYCTRLPHR